MLFLFLIGSFFSIHSISTAKAIDSPFHYENTWAKFNNYLVLNVTLHAEENNYTYAPHQEGVYPTKFTLYIDSSQDTTIQKNITTQKDPQTHGTSSQNISSQGITVHDTNLQGISSQNMPSQYITVQDITSINMLEQGTSSKDTSIQNATPQSATKQNMSMQGISAQNILVHNVSSQNMSSQNMSSQKFVEDIPILFPLGIKKPDPLNKSVQVYVYEKSQNIFILFPSTFTPLSADLGISFLACSEVRCQPLKTTLQLSPIENIQEAKDFPWFKEFEQRFIAMQNGDNTQVNIGNLAIESKQESNSISRVSINNNVTETTPAHSSNNSHSPLNSDFDISALRASIENKASQENKTHTFSPRPLNSSLEVYSLYKALLFGLIAGFILNFMPCVLPVIALKISSFLGSNQNDVTRLKSFREHNLFFALGILTWFMALALLLGLAGMSWGQLFQNPFIVLGLLIFIFAMSLSLFGIFHLPILDLRIVHENKNIKHNEKLQAFTSGLMATLLATPCSGPLLGSVLGYSLTQSIPVLLTIFFSMGFGMALPYLFFAINPRLIRFMPRAGNWMNTMEQILGFFLVATSIYLLSILPSDWYIKSLIILLLVALSAYTWGKWGSFHSSGLKKCFIALSCVTLIAAPSYYLLQKTEENIFWENFTNENFNELLGEELLLLKFTADWCPTCKVLEQTVFTKKNMQSINDDYNIRFLYVDITQFDEEKQNLLKSLDSVSIPLLAVFPKGELAKSPIIIRDLYTLNQLKEAIRLAN